MSATYLLYFKKIFTKMTNRKSNFGSANNSSNSNANNSRNEFRLLSQSQIQLLELLEPLDAQSFINALEKVHELALYHTKGVQKNEPLISDLYLVYLISIHIKEILKESKENPLFNLLNNEI